MPVRTFRPRPRAARAAAYLAAACLAAAGGGSVAAQDAAATVEALRAHCRAVLTRMQALTDDPRDAEQLAELAQVWRALDCAGLLAE